MFKKNHKRPPKLGSISYYIEEVVRYNARNKSGDDVENGYPPIVAELLVSILISVRAIRLYFGLMTGALLFFLLKLYLML